MGWYVVFSRLSSTVKIGGSSPGPGKENCGPASAWCPVYSARRKNCWRKQDETLKTLWKVAEEKESCRNAHLIQIRVIRGGTNNIWGRGSVNWKLFENLHSAITSLFYLYLREHLFSLADAKRPVVPMPKSIEKSGLKSGGQDDQDQLGSGNLFENCAVVGTAIKAIQGPWNHWSHIKILEHLMKHWTLVCCLTSVPGSWFLNLFLFPRPV